MNIELLPIGSVIKLENFEEEIMVLAWYPTSTEGTDLYISDYVGTCLPLGMHSGNLFHFNTSDIDEVLHKGFESKKTVRFQKEIVEWYKENKHAFKNKGE